MSIKDIEQQAANTGKMDSPITITITSAPHQGKVFFVKRLFSFCSEIHARRFPVPWVSPNLFFLYKVMS